MSGPQPSGGSDVPNRGPAVFAVSVATLAAASVFVAARMISRYFIVRSARWDDRIMILAWLFAVFLTFTIALGTTNGLGKHDTDIPRNQEGVLRRCSYVFSILYVRAYHPPPSPPVSTMYGASCSEVAWSC